MKPLFILITDTHLKEENASVVSNIFSQVLIEALKRDLTEVYCLGDVFESRKGQLAVLLSTFEDILDLYQDNGAKLITCVGNHDKTDYSSAYSFLSPFRHHPAFCLVSIYQSFQINENTIFSLLSFFDDVLYLQYITKLKTELSRDSPGKRHVLGTHIGISGVKMNSGDVFKSEKIQDNVFSMFEQVYVGHFHDASDYSENIHYVGSACQHNYGEDMDKGAIVINDFEDQLYMERILLDSPKYKTIELNVAEIDREEVDRLKELKPTNHTDRFRIILTGDQAALKSFDLSIFENSGLDVRIKVDKIERIEIEKNIHSFDNKDIKEQFVVFCNKQSIDLPKGQFYLDQIIK